MTRHPNPFLWCLVFGTFYFVFKGVWRHALISAAAAILTGGLSWFVYPFFAKKIMANFEAEQELHRQFYNRGQ